MTIQAIPNGLCERKVSIGLLQKNGMAVAQEFGVEIIHAVTACEDYFQPGFAGLKLLCQIHARDALGHDHVRDQKIDRTGLEIPNIERFEARPCFENVIAAIFEDYVRQIAQHRFIFHNQDGFFSASDYSGRGCIGSFRLDRL